MMKEAEPVLVSAKVSVVKQYDNNAGAPFPPYSDDTYATLTR